MKHYNLIGNRFGLLSVESIGDIKKVKSGTRKYWVCKCDCGNSCQVVSNALVRGKTKSCGCLRVTVGKARLREKHPNWKGGRHQNEDGYWLSLVDVNIKGGKLKYVLDHHLVMMEHLGRPLMKNETVHHKNGIKTDNRLENLELWAHSHGNGSRVEDKINWCVQFLKEYAPQLLKDDYGL